VSWCVSAGVASGALEVLAFGWWTRWPLGLGTAVYAIVAAGSHAALYGALGAVIGLLASPPAYDRGVPVARAVGTTVFAASAVFFWTGAWTLRQEGSPFGATVLASFPAVALAFSYFTARWLARGVAAGGPRPPLLWGALATVPLAAAASWLTAELRQPSGHPDRRMDLVLVTVDGLSEGEQGPAFRAFADEGVAFRQAVSPAPHSTRAAHASMLVGLHPVRHGVLDDAHPLARGHRSVFEWFADEGWATGAFVSDPALAAGCGLEQGFGTWDDAFVPAWRRPWLVARALERASVGDPGWRPADDTVSAFAAWLEPRKSRPFAVLVHLADPVHVAQGALPADQAIARLRTVLSEAGVLEHTVVVLAGAHGASLSEPRTDLRDAVVHVPLALRLPEPLQKPEVTAQVRLFDVANTLLDALRFRVDDESEGVALLAYGTGLRKATLSSTLLGRDERGRWFLGLRNNGVKFVVDADGAERMYDLAADPAETRDISAEQVDTVRKARAILDAERAAMQRWTR
jgi:hypothetical protein